MKSILEMNIVKENYPIKVIQFGEGNFLRAFVEWQIQQMNNKNLFKGSVAVVQPIEKGLVDVLKQQNGLYTVILEGLLNGKKVQTNEVISCVEKAINPYDNFQEYLDLAQIDSAEIIFSNTTEAGIQFDDSDKIGDVVPKTYPGKLTALLYERFNLKKRGFQIIPCELINHNGEQLQECVLKYANLWNLGEEFVSWIRNENTFYSTLVDRIVPGYPKEEASEICKRLGYEDKLLDKAEAFLLFVIEGDKKIKEYLPLSEAGMNIIVTDNMQPYRERKVRLLNAPHSTMTPLGLLAGIRTVGEIMDDEDFEPFISDEMKNEISPIIPLPENELASYSEVVKERFKNPFVHHELESIALNSISKYKSRLLPVLKAFVAKYEKLPERVVLALASYLVIYGNYDGIVVKPVDDPEVIHRFKEIKETSNDYVMEVLREKTFWGEDLTAIPNLVDTVTRDVNDLLRYGSRFVVQKINKETK